MPCVIAELARGLLRRDHDLRRTRRRLSYRSSQRLGAPSRVSYASSSKSRVEKMVRNPSRS